MNDVQTMRENAGEAAQFLKTVSHPERLMVLCQLLEGEKGVTELLKDSSLGQSAFSQHLAILRREGIVLTRKSSQQVFYRLANDHVHTLFGALKHIYC